MAVQDILNNGNYNFQLPTQEDYQPSQFNAKGDSLSPTPTGAPISVDADNDQRNSQQFKQDALQAQQDTAAAYDTTNKIVGSTGYHYDKIDDTRIGQARSAAMAFAEGYLSHMGDQGAATAAGALGASQAVSNHAGALKRQSLIHDLESKGYNPIDIDKWIQTGDTKDLVVNKGSWKNDGHGTLYNDLTGETKTDPNYQSNTKPQQLHYLKNPDGTYTAVDPVTNQVVGGNVGQAKPTTDNGGDIGLDDVDNNPAFKEDGNGGVLKLDGYDKNHNPKYVAASTKEADAYYNRGTTQAPDANQQLVSDDLTTVNSASDDQLDKFTGQFVGRNATARDWETSRDPEIRKVYTASQRLGTQLGNSAIAAAKAAGASGINTEAEIKRFTSGVPQPDYTSVANFKNSVKQIQEYAENYKQSLIKKHGKSTAGSNSSTKDLSDDELINMYGG